MAATVVNEVDFQVWLLDESPLNVFEFFQGPRKESEHDRRRDEDVDSNSEKFVHFEKSQFQGVVEGFEWNDWDCDISEEMLESDLQSLQASRDNSRRKNSSLVHVFMVILKRNIWWDRFLVWIFMGLGCIYSISLAQVECENDDDVVELIQGDVEVIENSSKKYKP
ncbi:hypothetical protein RIF29_04987 [Crotalaria pallida]|uniref:Transmembrane protein n=1 Tax=Crotalaria pallida TaxID=3830 RepID=A0AAN9J1R7_CROPI